MLLTIEQNATQTVMDLVKAGRFTQSLLDSSLMANNEERTWDGYIHPSHLDWTKTPEKQFEAHVNKGSFRFPVEALRRFELGNLIHDRIQMLIEQQVDGWREVRFNPEELKFHGTADFIMQHELLGGVVFEFKSFSELQRDASFGERIKRKFETHLKLEVGEKERHYKSKLTGKEETLTHVNRYNLFTDHELNEAYDRMMSYKKVYKKADEAHLTQAFTYAWIARKLGIGKVQRFDNTGNAVLTKKGKEVWDEIELPRVKWVCVCYIGKNGMETQEFWYRIKDHKDLIKKAAKNYKRILNLVEAYHAT